MNLIRRLLGPLLAFQPGSTSQVSGYIKGLSSYVLKVRWRSLPLDIRLAIQSVRHQELQNWYAFGNYLLGLGLYSMLRVPSNFSQPSELARF